MSERVLRVVVERMAADREFSALVKQDPENALGDYDLTDDERGTVLGLGADATGRAHRLAPRLTKSSLVFGHLGRGVDHLGAAHSTGGHEAPLDVGTPVHGAVDVGLTPASDADQVGTSFTPHGSGVDIFEGVPAGWSLPEPGAHGDAGVAGLGGSPWEASAGVDTASMPADAASHNLAWDAMPAHAVGTGVATDPGALSIGAHGDASGGWSPPGGGGDAAVWQLPQHGDGTEAGLGGGGVAGTGAVVLGGPGADVERIPGLGELFASGTAVGELAGGVPVDVLDTFGSLGHSVVASMTTAITTSVGDAFSVGAAPIRYIEDINW
ncbi:MAG: hypothetical protein E6J14_14950 [Chloroflexi bacterium]|nr:MAG: hypothetical protein E6J14_14950 [Chloroflexota bacterium]